MLFFPEGDVRSTFLSPPPSPNRERDLGFVSPYLEMLLSSPHSGGQMWGEGGAAATELALQSLHDTAVVPFENPTPQSSIWTGGGEEAAAFDIQAFPEAALFDNLTPLSSIWTGGSEEAAEMGRQLFPEAVLFDNQASLSSFWELGEAAAAEPDSSSTSGSVRRTRGRSLLICPEHHNEVFKSKAAFTEHIESHGNVFHCSQEGCPSSSHIFQARRHLYVHVILCHGSEVVGKQSFHFQCGHCEQIPTLRKESMLGHLKSAHLREPIKRTIRYSREVEKYCLPPEDPSNPMRIFTLAPEFLSEAAEIDPPTSDDSPPADDLALSAPAPRRRGEALKICPQHHELVFQTRDEFKAHIRSHGDKFHCSQEGCSSSGYNFKTLRSLYWHVTQIHGSEIVGKKSFHFGCGHCGKPSTLKKVSMLIHLRSLHLVESEKNKIISPLEVEKYCLPAEDPSNLVRIFTLAPEFLRRLPSSPADQLI